MENNQQRKFQEPNESLHWISYNLKGLVKEVARVATTLDRIAEKLEKKNDQNGDLPF